MSREILLLGPRAEFLNRDLACWHLDEAMRERMRALDEQRTLAAAERLAKIQPEPTPKLTLRGVVAHCLRVCAELVDGK